MAKIDIECHENHTDVHIQGTIDETFDLVNVPTDAKKTLNFYLKDVIRVNSTGIKKWIIYFQDLDKRKVQVLYFEIAAPLVEQFNAISNFGAHGRVESLCLPYLCNACKNPFVVVKSRTEVRALAGSVPSESCPKCLSSNTEFDDIEDEYLRFLNR